MENMKYDANRRESQQAYRKVITREEQSQKMWRGYKHQHYLRIMAAAEHVYCVA